MSFIIPHTHIEALLPGDLNEFIQRYRCYQCEVAAEKGDLQGLYEWSKYLGSRSDIEYSIITIENAIKHNAMEWVESVGFEEEDMEYVIKHDKLEWFKTTGMSYIEDNEKIMEYAIQYKKLHFIKFMTDNDIEFTLLDKAIQTGDVAFLRELLEILPEESFEMHLDDRRTPLEAAAASGNVAMCQYIWDKWQFSETYFTHDDSMDYISRAIESSSVPCLQFFLDKKFRCDDSHLTLAVKYSTPEVVKLILQQGCKPEAKAITFVVYTSNNKKFPFRKWKEEEYVEITKLFFQAAPKYQKGAFFREACLSNSPEMFKFICEDLSSALQPKEICSFFNRHNGPTAKFIEGIQSCVDMSSEAYKIAILTFCSWNEPHHVKELQCQMVDWCFKYIAQDQIKGVFDESARKSTFRVRDLVEQMERFGITTRDKLFTLLESNTVDKFSYKPLINQMKSIKRYHTRVMNYLHDERKTPLLPKDIIDILCNYI